MNCEGMSPIELVGYVEEPSENTFIRTQRIEYNAPIAKLETYYYHVCFESEENLDSVNVNLVADVKSDVLKWGIWALFQPNFQYRYVAVAKVDFKNSTAQEGKMLIKRN